MNLLLDTHLLLWASSEPCKLQSRARKLIVNLDNQLYFSVASLWEIVIKNAIGRSDFQVNVHVFRRALLDNGYNELSISAAHVMGVDQLPCKHRDPFDRLLISQSIVEGMTLMTCDGQIAAYEGPIQFFQP